MGKFPSLRAGEFISCKGQWKHHPSHGRQFIVTDFDLALPKDILGIRRYLESGAVRGIGPVNARRIVEAFGHETLEVIDNDPERLLDIEGIGKKKLMQIIDHWQEQRSIRSIMVFLRGHGISCALAKKIYRKYGEETVSVLQNDPYRASREIFGIGFKTADKIAAELGIAKESEIRVEAGLEHVLNELSDEGHVCVPEQELIEAAEKMLEIDQHLFRKALISLEESGRIIRKTIPNSDPPLVYVWSRPLFFSEIGIAKELARIVSNEASIRPIKTDKAIEWVQEKLHISFSKEQKKAIVESVCNKVHIITGGPGTGKSTVTNAILAIHRKLSDKIILCAPTGKAAKRLSEITHWKALTIHSLLEYDFTNGGFKKGSDNRLTCDLLIVDEASMIDTFLLYSLLKAIPDYTRVIFIGDIDQLPSVGPGNTLKDMIDSHTVTTTKLYQIFRQAKNSKIITNAHNINKGLMPDLIPPEQNSDFLFYESDNPEEMVSKIIRLCKEEVPRAYNLHPTKQIQVLAPMKRGMVGIENLNVALQKALNPTSSGIERFGRSLKVGDKVMQIRNNYNRGVLNGDVGWITEIDTDDGLVLVDFDGNEVEYDFSELDEIVLAYAVSIHKYQGSESPCIIMPVHTSHFKLLKRNLLYTGITRGKKLVILIASKRAVAMAVKNNDVEKRHTCLSYFLSEKMLKEAL